MWGMRGLQQAHSQWMTFKRNSKAKVDSVLGWTAIKIIRVAGLLDLNHAADVFALVARKVGPWLPHHQRGLTNLRAAYPDKSESELSEILSDVWDNLGRFGAEVAHLERFAPDLGKFLDATSLEELNRICRTSSPSIYFTAHLANWELPATVPRLVGLDSYVLYRPPNNRVVGEAILAVRRNCMGTLIPSGLDAPLRLFNALKKGGHVGMLVDQRFGRGIDVNFFGRKCKANPLVAQLARRMECPVRGVRVIRLADRRTFRGELTEPIDLPRGPDGKIDVPGATQAITSIIEGWIREDPGQWLWLHNRWR